MISQKYAPYPTRRCSGVGWLGEIPEHWNTKRLGNLFWESNARAASETEKEHPVLSVSIHHGISDKELDEEELDRKVTRSEDKSLYKVVQTNDLAYNMMRAWQGGFGAAKISGLISPAYVVCRPRLNANSEYFELLLRTPNAISEVKRFSRGITDFRLRLYWDDFKVIEVPVPPDRERRSILKFIDYETAKIDALIEKQQQLIALLKEKRQAVISHAVTKGLNPDAPMRDSGVEWLGEVPAHWETLNLNRVVSTFVDYRGRTPEKTDGGRPLVTAGAVRNGIVDLDRAPQFVSEGTYHLLRQRGLPEVGDLLFTSEAPLGEVAIVEDVQIACAQRIIMFKLERKRILPQFMWLYLRSQAGQDEIQTKASGSTAEGIRADRLKRCRVLVPTLGEQAQIVLHVTEELGGFDEILQKAHEQTELLQERRTALISAAVTGKIDVRGWKAPESETHRLE